MTTGIKASFDVDYGNFRLDVDLELPGHGVTVLFGHSGSGKTTLLRCIAGLQKAAKGFLTINGDVWQDSAGGLFVPTHKRSLGYVFQDANLFPHLSVRGNLQFGLKRCVEPRADLTTILDLLGIGHLLDRMPDKLSGGERQRVAIARALALNPKVLLMDEPLAALDFKRKQEILPYLNRLHQSLNLPMLYVTHSHQEVAQLADHLVVLHEGRVIVSGPLSDTLSRLDMPLAHERDASTVWVVQVSAHEPDYCLTHVAFDGGTLRLPQLSANIGAALRVQIHARDVSISLREPADTSILNVVPAVVIGIADTDNGQSVIGLKVGSQSLLAHITRKSSSLLALRTGMAVYVQIKGMSILN